MTLILAAEWTNDCQGKKDYDCSMIEVSTRYWPRGGGYDLYDPVAGFESNDDRPDIKPSARSHIQIRYQSDEGIDWKTLTEQDFEANTQEEVQQLVEIWAQQKFEEIVGILEKHYKMEAI